MATSATAGQRWTAIVGGATARTGPAVLRTFLQAGYQVVATTRREAELRRYLAGLPGGDAVEVVSADLLDPAAAERVVGAALARFGQVDAVTVLAQGGFVQRPFAETSLDELRRLIEGNLYLTYNLCRAVLPPMLERGHGHIVTVAGGSALDPGYGRALFGASKAAVVTLTKGIARDYKARGIVANCLVAGTIATEDAARYLDEAAVRAAATMDEFAQALCFLCSPQSSGINGAAVELNAREVD
ncbi:MAG TPA: SDR family oxidoreductase [Chloroflexota bacterium]|nr:SDR family oxidoreductase [Chloroflexota bacterium]